MQGFVEPFDSYVKDSLNDTGFKKDGGENNDAKFDLVWQIIFPFEETVNFTDKDTLYDSTCLLLSYVVIVKLPL